MAQHGGDVETSQPGLLKPICPTRWLTRLFAVKFVLQNYSYVFDALKQAAVNFGTNTAARANGIYICLANSKCVLGLHAASPILEILESLNRSLQSLSVHVDGMMNSVRHVKSELINLRTTKKLDDIFKEAQNMSDNLKLEYISFPRKKRLQDDIKVVNLQNSRTAMLKTVIVCDVIAHGFTAFFSLVC